MSHDPEDLLDHAEEAVQSIIVAIRDDLQDTWRYVSPKDIFSSMDDWTKTSGQMIDEFEKYTGVDLTFSDPKRQSYWSKRLGVFAYGMASASL